MRMVDDYQLPEELYYHKKHFWVRLEGEIAVIGATDFSQRLAGKIDYIELPEVGTEVRQDSAIGSIETGKWIGKIIAPLSGRITQVNVSLDDKPRLINKSPFEDGWLFKIRLDKALLEEELKNLVFGDDAVKWQEEEIKKYK